jgi:hypothetical protein
MDGGANQFGTTYIHGGTHALSVREYIVGVCQLYMNGGILAGGCAHGLALGCYCKYNWT